MKSRLVPLFIACALPVLIASHGLAEDHPPKPYEHYSVLVVKRIPVAEEVMQEFGKISGIDRVYVNAKARRVTLKLKAKSTPSALAIWQTAEQLKLEPVRLVTLQQIYTSKPDSEAGTVAKGKSRQGADR